MSWKLINEHIAYFESITYPLLLYNKYIASIPKTCSTDCMPDLYLMLKGYANRSTRIATLLLSSSLQYSISFWLDQTTWFDQIIVISFFTNCNMLQTQFTYETCSHFMKNNAMGSTSCLKEYLPHFIPKILLKTY